MLLAIDVGNTNTVIGLFDGDRMERSWRVKTDARATADEMWLTYRGLLEGEPEVSDRETLFFSARVIVESLALDGPTMLLYEASTLWV